MHATDVISLGHTQSINAIATTPNGEYIFSGSSDGTIRVWDSNSAKCQKIFHTGAQSITTLLYFDTDDILISKTQSGQIQLWDLSSDSAGRALKTDGIELSALVFDSMNSRLITTDGHSIMYWDIQTGACTKQYPLAGDNITALAVAPEKGILLAGLGNNSICCVDLESGLRVNVCEEHTRPVTALAVSGSGNRFASGSEDGTVLLWDMTTCKCIDFCESLHQRIRKLAITEAGETILALSGTSTVNVWSHDTQTSTLIKGHLDLVTDLALTDQSAKIITSSADKTIRVWTIANGRCTKHIKGHPGTVTSMAISQDMVYGLSGSDLGNIRLWDLHSTNCDRILRGHSAAVTSLCFSPSAPLAASGAADSSVKLWDLENGTCLKTLNGHSGAVTALAFSSDGELLFSGATDMKIKCWNISDSTLRYSCVGHGDAVTSLAISSSNSLVASASEDCDVIIWDANDGTRVKRLKGHTRAVNGVSWSSDGKLLVSASDDRTVRLWNLDDDQPPRILEGHTKRVAAVSLHEVEQLHSVGSEGSIRLWDTRTQFSEEYQTDVWFTLAFRVSSGDAVLASSSGYFRRVTLQSGDKSQNGQYTNAKVLFVGDSGAGKTGLSSRLANGIYSPSPGSTVGVWATHLSLPGHLSDTGIEREIWLWDFAGQSDQRIIHQLYTDRCGAILLLFNADLEDPITSLREWLDALERSAAHAPLMILVAARTDVGFRAPRHRLQQFAANHNMRYVETSAMTGQGCEELIALLKSEIPWDSIEVRSSPPVFKTIRDEIVKLRDSGNVLLTFDKLQHLLERNLGWNDNVASHLEAVVALLDGPGVVKELDFGRFVLLRPEWISRYAQAVIRTLRSDDLQLGSIDTLRVKNGDLVFSVSYEDGVREEERLPVDDERVVLRAMEEALVAKCLCLRLDDKLVFPSHCGRERPSIPIYPNVSVSYRFGGYLDDVYATLVTRLFYSRAFTLKQIWRDAADFSTLNGERSLGVRLVREDDGSGAIQLYREPNVGPEEEVIFANFIHEHLKRTAKDVVRQRHYSCPSCNEPYLNLNVVSERLESLGELAQVMCTRCEKRFDLWDRLERLFAEPSVQDRVHKLEEVTKLNVDSRRKGEILVGEVRAIIAEADQKAQEYSASNDEGLDLLLEFTDDSHAGTGVFAFLQLKSGNSHLRKLQDGSERFDIKKPHWIQYWKRQSGPVFLIVGTFPDDHDPERDRLRFKDLRWMEIREELLQRLEKGEDIKSLEFDGKIFTKHTVLEWRRRYASQYVNV